MIDKKCKGYCRWCERPLYRRNRKFCSDECREFASGCKESDPTPEEIREMCRQIREEGGEEWERSRSCYSSEPVTVPMARVSLSDTCVTVHRAEF